MSIRVILADDHEIMREGLRLILSRVPDVQVVGEASDGRDVLEMARRLNPQIVIMDVGMPQLNGIDATRQLLADIPDVKVIALSALADRRYVLGMLEAGACGYVVKAAAGDELVKALQAASQGKKFISPEVAGSLVDAYTHREFSGGGSLSQREREILQQLAEGKTSKEIGLALTISTRTVETHRRNIMQKLNVHNLADLTRYAIREGLVQVN